MASDPLFQSPTKTPHFFNAWMLGPLFIIITSVAISILYCMLAKFCSKTKVCPFLCISLLIHSSTLLIEAPYRSWR